MATDQKQVLDMFQRPFQRRKGEGRPIAFEPSTRPGVSWDQQLSLAHSVPKGSVFSTFMKSHSLAAKELCDYFMETTNVLELRQRVDQVRSSVNEKLLIFALSFVILRKQEFRHVRLPTVVEVFPSMFVPVTTLAEMEQSVKDSTPDEEIVVTEYGAEFSSKHLKPEHRMSYWREDYGINSHHWHWHLVYPCYLNIRRDRKGELFYYMHQQMLARYDMDRLSVNLTRVDRLNNWRIPIPDGYFSKLTINNSSQAWGTRQDNTLMQDYRRDPESTQTDISEMEQWHSRIMAAIHKGFLFKSDGSRIKLSDDVRPPQRRGIEFLGDAVEADHDLSPNFTFYGNLHNMGHNVISAAHDPDNAHKENLGVMSENGTAMRDPSFYRWHKYIDDIFQEYKLTQNPYTEDDLSFASVEVVSVGVVSGENKNHLTTGLNTKDFEASHGLDFNSEKPVVVRLTHLDHHPFHYSILVNNNDNVPRDVTLRIFMAPKNNERGVEMNFMEQRLLWAEMDRFTHNLKPGPNLIQRLSTSSSVTNSNDFTFRDLEMPNQGDPEEDLKNFCGCGWPQHMLLPRGKQGGMAFELFVMVTDWNQDRVQNPVGSRTCSDASSFCGVLDALYPDARPMGFPFDRRPMPELLNKRLTKVSDLTQLSNIAMQDITITFTNQQI